MIDSRIPRGPRWRIWARGFVRAGFEVVEVPIVFRDRQLGQSKMSWRIALEAMWLVPRLRFR